MAIIQTYPKLSIIAFALLISLAISIVNYFVLDKEKLRDIKQKQKLLQEESKKHKDNPQKLMEINQQMLSHSMEIMKHSFKPLIITMIPILLFFSFIRNAYASTSIASSWIWYYIGTSIVGSTIFRKLLKLP